jgi:hypothetical protein
MVTGFFMIDFCLILELIKPRDHPCQVWFNLVPQFQRRRFKCDLLSKYAGLSLIVLKKSLLFVSPSERNHFFTLSRGGFRGGRTRRAPPLKLEKNIIFWRKIVIFHTKYPKIFARLFSDQSNITSILETIPLRAGADPGFQVRGGRGWRT